jgi:hypothetical protein
LNENYLIPEAKAAAEKPPQEIMHGSTFDDFLGPEISKTSK